MVTNLVQLSVHQTANLPYSPGPGASGNAPQPPHLPCRPPTPPSGPRRPGSRNRPAPPATHPRRRIPPVVSPPGLATRARQPPGAQAHRPCARPGALLSCALPGRKQAHPVRPTPQRTPAPSQCVERSERRGGQELKRGRRNEHLDKQHPSSAIAARGRRNPILDTPHSARTSRTGPVPATPRPPERPGAPAAPRSPAGRRPAHPQRNASAPPHSPCRPPIPPGDARRSHNATLLRSQIPLSSTHPARQLAPIRHPEAGRGRGRVSLVLSIQGTTSIDTYSMMKGMGKGMTRVCLTYRDLVGYAFVSNGESETYVKCYLRFAEWKIGRN